MTDIDPVRRRAAILLTEQFGETGARAAADLLDQAGMLIRPSESVPGPYPIYVRRTGLGAVLDVHALVAALIVELASQFTEDPEAVGDQLASIAASSGPERDALLEELIGELGGASQRLPASAAQLLADRLTAAVGPAIPRQQNRRAA